MVNNKECILNFLKKLLTVGQITVERRLCLDVFNKKLCLKVEPLSGYNTEIVQLCEVSNLEVDIGKAETIAAKTCRAEIDKVITCKISICNNSTTQPE